MTLSKKKMNKAWVVSVDMGYGHQRAADALRHLASGGIINANSYGGIPPRDRKIWQESRRFYEFISRFKQIPLIGEELFHLYDKLQNIPPYYPKRDLSEPTFQVLQIMSLIRKSLWGKHLMAKLAAHPLPMICTFFVPAFMAEYFNYPGDIYCLVTDTDISRAWVSEAPERSRIMYLAPTHRAADRLMLYGVKQKNILYTGFPLPLENLGDATLARLKRDILYRLVNLDPKRTFYGLHRADIAQHLGYKRLPSRPLHPLTLVFSVGGAGAQKHLAVEILSGLKPRIMEHRLRYVMVAGVNKDVSAFFRKGVAELGLRSELGKHVDILEAKSKAEYFQLFNRLLRTSDILWTKPSELSFYTALGIPIIMAPAIGSQEHFNRKWVESVGAGADQEDPAYAYEWLFDWLDSGWLAEAAIEGFVEGPKFGTFNIERLISKKLAPVPKLETALQY